MWQSDKKRKLNTNPVKTMYVNSFFVPVKFLLVLTNYFQENVILSANQPFNQYFDASLVWGPVSGRMFYTGLRFRIR